MTVLVSVCDRGKHVGGNEESADYLLFPLCFHNSSLSKFIKLGLCSDGLMKKKQLK